MTRKLPQACCPLCSKQMSSEAFRPNKKDGARRAHSYETCLRRCESCRVAYSNQATGDTARLTLIHACKLGNVPEDVRGHAACVVSQALNERNRTAKWSRFGFSTSEDALTWTVFSWLQRAGNLRQATSKALDGLVQPLGPEPQLLLWGTPVPPATGSRGWALRSELERVADSLVERSDSRSEPDVILDFRERLVFVEVKYQKSGNIDSKVPAWKYRKYTNATTCFSDVKRMQASGCYELARNWRLGTGLGSKAGKPFLLLNLGLPKLFKGKNGVGTSLFAGALKRSNGNDFRTIIWPDFCRAIPGKPDWLQDYLALRGVS